MRSTRSSTWSTRGSLPIERKRPEASRLLLVQCKSSSTVFLSVIVVRQQRRKWCDRRVVCAPRPCSTTLVGDTGGASETSQSMGNREKIRESHRSCCHHCACLVR